MKNLQDLKTKEEKYIKKIGGYENLTEFDKGINDIQRDKIKAFKELHKKAFLGKINFYGDNRKNINNMEILKEYKGQKVLNFEYEFIAPCKDETLINLIKEYNKKEFFEAIVLIDKVFDRIEEINGINLTWV